jgi:hypothetical protein
MTQSDVLQADGGELPSRALRNVQAPSTRIIVGSQSRGLKSWAGILTENGLDAAL